MTEPNLFDNTELTVLGELERVVIKKFLVNEIGNDHNRGYNEAIREVLSEIDRLKPAEIDQLKQAFAEGYVQTESAESWVNKFRQ